MNFYIGNSIDEIKGEYNNVEVDDELLEYVYSLKKKIPFTALYDIDPYGDAEIEKETITDVINLCRYVLETKLLKDYEE